MEVEVRIFAGLNKYVPGTENGEPFSVALPEGATGGDLIKKLQIPEAEAFVFLVNGRREDFTKPLQNEDRVGIFPPVGGGA